MRKIFIGIITALSLCTSLHAQQSLRMADGQGNIGGSITTLNQQGIVNGQGTGRDSTVVDRGVPRDVKMFDIDPTLGTIIPIETDTAVYNFQNLHFTDGMNGEYSHLGNMGSPRLSRIFFNRKSDGQFLFTDALDFFLTTPGEFHFTDTKSPWSNISYYRAGNKRNGEERFIGRFGVNSSKRTGIGFNIDYLFGRGLYAHQSTAYFDGSLYGYHHGERYSINLLYSYDKLRLAENGGIADDRYVTNPEAMAEGKKSYRPEDMPTNLNRTWNENILHTIFLAQDYNLGYYKTRTDSLPDTVIIHRDFVAVSKVFHTLEASTKSRRFIDYVNTKDYYAHDYLPYDSIDATRYLHLRNTVGLTLIEGFNRWIPFGASAYATHEYRQFTLSDSIGGSGLDHIHTYTENNILVGGNLKRTTGKAFLFDVTAETVLAGTDLGAFRIEGNADFNFRLGKDTIRLRAEGYMKNVNPSFYYRHYHSQHYWWDNDLHKEFRTRLGGSIGIDRWHTRLYAGVENIKNYTYLAGTPYMYPENIFSATPRSLSNITARQYTKNLQVLSSTLYQDFKLGILHWDNEATVQYSSNQDVLPLPLVNLYSNLYLQFTYAKVLRIQLGGDVRWFSRYYAPDYAPALEQYFVQEGAQRVELGGYPFINAYINFHLKQVRFYVMYHHVTQNALKQTNSFLVPHYPINPRMFKLGFSWNFWD
jgi:hypothetical protein